MKHKIILQLLCVATSILLFSCEDFIERDLGGKTITIYAPANNAITSNYTQSFWWESLKGAERYKLQIVKPSFGAVQQLIVDTIIRTNQFVYTLQPGVYQWRLRGENNSSQSDYVTYNLTIDSSLNLSSQTLLLNSPIDNYYTNIFANNFSWFAMPNATDYVFGIFNSSGIQIGSYQSTTGTSLAYTYTAEGVYKWRVFAQNSQSSSPYSERTITIDTTRPMIPTITYLPLNDTTSLNPIPLSWNNVETNALYRVQIATDTNFTALIKDTTTISTGYSFYNATIGVFYYWKVKSIDLAGNMSIYTNRKRIKRQ